MNGYTVIIESRCGYEAHGRFAARSLARPTVTGLLAEYTDGGSPTGGVEDYCYQTTDSRGYPVHIRIVPVSTTVCKEVC